MELAATIRRTMAMVVSRIAAIPPAASRPTDVANGRTVARPVSDTTMAASLFFSLIWSRYERRSLTVTSNKNFSSWAEIFGDAVAVAAGHRGRKPDPLYRIRRLLTAAHERISDQGQTRLRGLLEAGDPHGEVRTAWHAKETVRGIYEIDTPALALRYTLQLADDLQDQSCPPEINKLGRSIPPCGTALLADEFTK